MRIIVSQPGAALMRQEDPGENKPICMAVTIKEEIKVSFGRRPVKDSISCDALKYSPH